MKISGVEAWVAIISLLSAIMIDPLRETMTGDVFTALQKRGGALSCCTYKENHVHKNMSVGVAEYKCHLQGSHHR